MKNIVKISSLVGLGIVFSVTVAFAAVQLSVSQQRIKTLRATFTYQDVVGAPQIEGNPTTRLLELVDVPAETEIMSAYINITNAFVADAQTLIGSLDLYQVNNIAVDFPGLLLSDMISLGIKGGAGDFPVIVISDEPTILNLTITSDGDLGDLTSGSAEIFVNYLEH